MTTEISAELLTVRNYNREFYYPIEIIQEMMPGFDEITHYIIYLRYNENFIDEQEKKDIEAYIEKLKKRKQSVINMENELFQQNKDNEEALKKRKSIDNI